jgi:hypothetical protein
MVVFCEYRMSDSSSKIGNDLKVFQKTKIEVIKNNFNKTFARRIRKIWMILDIENSL